MDALRRYLRDQQEMSQAKPHDLLAREGNNYGTGRTDSPNPTQTVMATGQMTGSAVALKTGNVAVGGNSVSSVGSPPPSQGTEPPAATPPTRFSTNGVFVAKRSGGVPYEGNKIPEPRDEGETSETQGTTGLVPTGEADDAALQEFLNTAQEIRGELPNSPGNTTEGNAINIAFRQMLTAGAAQGVKLTIYPPLLGGTGADWESTLAFTYDLTYFGNPFWSVGVRPTGAIPPYIQPTAEYPFPPAITYGYAQQALYELAYLQSQPPRYDGEFFFFRINIFDSWGFWLQAFNFPDKPPNTGDPNRRPNREGKGMITPTATQYAVGGGASPTAMSQVTVEFDRATLATVPLSGNNGYDILLANDMNVRRLRYSQGAIVADDILSDRRLATEYPFVEFSEANPGAEEGEEYTPERNYTVNYTSPAYRNVAGKSYGTHRNSFISKQEVQGNPEARYSPQNLLVLSGYNAQPYITDPYQEEGGEPLPPRESGSGYDVMHHSAHHATSFGSRGGSRQFNQTNTSPDYDPVDRFNRTNKTYTAPRQNYDGNVPAPRLVADPVGLSYGMRGLGLEVEAPTLTATQFDPGAEKYTRETGKDFEMGYWELTAGAFVSTPGGSQ